MREGWLGDEHFVLFDDAEAIAALQRYDISSAFPEAVALIGLRGWDDFILRDNDGLVFTVPTVPLVRKHAAPFEPPAEQARLQPDARCAGKIKWYVKPIVFGGDPRVGENLIWIDHAQHAELVRWWNKQYRDLTSQGGSG